MNFLAHLYLSENKTESIVGNFIADHVKGNTIDLYNDDIKSGIRFHRSVDSFTDHNTTTHEAIIHLRPYYRKYAGVVLDMYYDHFLASGWDQWSSEPLTDFSIRMFDVLKSSGHLMPLRSQRLLAYLAENDMLVKYKDLDGLKLALTGISKRTTFISNIETAAEHLNDHYSYYSDSFNHFFPQLVEYRRITNQVSALKEVE